MAAAIDKIEEARAAGLAIAADMYTYTAGATGLSNCIPPWFHEGGQAGLFERLADAAVRAEIRSAIEGDAAGWENLYHHSGGAEGVLLLQTPQPRPAALPGEDAGRVRRDARLRPDRRAYGPRAQDRSRITTAYFQMSEDNVSLGLKQPWVSLGSDAVSMAPEGVFLTRSTHPRAYGNFARFLGKYVRDEGSYRWQKPSAA